MISKKNIYVLLLFINLASPASQEIYYSKNTSAAGEEKSFDTENILCRGCGNVITLSNSLLSKISPSSHYSYHDSVFGKDEVLIQVLMSDFILPYFMITNSQSNCVGVSEWEEEDSWYPGYLWKPCVCPVCGAIVGWVFEPEIPDLVDQPGTFFGHILTRLIGESFINSLLIVPGDQSIF